MASLEVEFERKRRKKDGGVWWEKKNGAYLVVHYAMIIANPFRGVVSGDFLRVFEFSQLHDTPEPSCTLFFCSHAQRGHTEAKKGREEPPKIPAMASMRTRNRSLFFGFLKE